MKKSILKMIGIICLSAIMTVLCALPVMASDEASVEPECFWPMDEPQYEWVGENASLDILEYSDYDVATAARLYSAAWAGRYGGVAIISKENNITVSAEKNRFLVVNVMPDFLAIENHFDKFSAIYWESDNPSPGYCNVAKDAFSALHNATEDEFHKIIVDLNWEEEFVLETLRLEIFSSSYEAAADDQEGYNCGKLYFEYIALFDTLEDATNFVYGTPDVEEPTQVPGTNDPGNAGEPTSTPEVTNAPEATQEPEATSTATKAPEGGDDGDSNKKSPAVGIVIGIVVVLLIVVIAIVFIVKPKKK